MTTDREPQYGLTGGGCRATHTLTINGLAKHFGRVPANDGINITFQSGEIHALLGENGAGKSTLIKILAGVYRPDAGSVRLDDDELLAVRGIHGRDSSLGFVHQRSTLIPRLTLLENVVLTEGNGWGRPEPQLATRLAESCRRVGVDTPLRMRVELLSQGQRQRAEIARALLRNARFLVLDEPTAVLTPAEREALFELLKDLARAGVGIIVVTHHIDEALQHSDRVTVLRAGRVVGNPGEPAGSLGKAEVIERMVGALELRSTREGHRAGFGAPVLDVRGVCGTPPDGRPLVDVTVAVRAGEILGVAGVEGNGQRELAAALTGAWRPSAGSVTVSGRDVRDYSPGERAALIADVPDDHGLATVDALPVWQNMALSRMAWKEGPAPRSGRRMRREAQDAVREFEIKTLSVDAPISQLSGGNRQRVVLARELSKSPIVVVLCFPTKGLDVRSAEQVRAWVLAAARKQAAVIYISAELDEVIEISDRIAVMAGGRVAGVFESGNADAHVLGAMMLSGAAEDAADHVDDLLRQ